MSRRSVSLPRWLSLFMILAALAITADMVNAADYDPCTAVGSTECKTPMEAYKQCIQNSMDEYRDCLSSAEWDHDGFAEFIDRVACTAQYEINFYACTMYLTPL